MSAAAVPRRKGIAKRPLHRGKALRWLFDPMVKLAREITIAIVAEYSPEEMQGITLPGGVASFLGVCLNLPSHVVGIPGNPTR